MRSYQFCAGTDQLGCAVEPIRSRVRNSNAVYARGETTFDQRDVIAASVSLHKALFGSLTFDKNFHFAPDPLMVLLERDFFAQLDQPREPLDLRASLHVVEVHR